MGQTRMPLGPVGRWYKPDLRFLRLFEWKTGKKWAELDICHEPRQNRKTIDKLRRNSMATMKKFEILMDDAGIIQNTKLKLGSVL